MVMLLTVSRIPLLISGLQHWVIRVNGLPFKKQNKTILPLVSTSWYKQPSASSRGGSGEVEVGGGIRVNRRWEDYRRRERKGREVGVLKRGQREKKEKNAFKSFAIEKAKEKGVGAGKALRVQKVH